MNNINSFVSKYYIERKNTESIKWDALNDYFNDNNLTPMWVADMDFKSPEFILDALNQRINHGAFGYSKLDDSYFNAFNKWQQTMHNVTIRKEWINFATGVVNTLYWIVQAFTKPDDGVLILTPVYYPFKGAIVDNNRKLVRSEIILNNGRYEIDFNDVVKQIKQHNVKLFIHCSPHNPLSRVWDKDELIKLSIICLEHNVLFLSDEVHQDIITGNKKFISALSLNEEHLNNLIVLNAASKTFNLASLLHSHAIIPNKDIRTTYEQHTNKVHKSTISILGATASKAGYLGGKEWLNNLLMVVNHNYQLLKGGFNDAGLDIFMPDLEGTYLAWIDLTNVLGTMETKEFIQDKCRLAIDFGEWFSDKSTNFIRINLATSPSIINYAKDQIIKYAQNNK